MNFNTNWLYTIGRLLLVILIQILTMDSMLLFGFVNPLFYCFYILFYPISGNRVFLIASSFFLGLLMDAFNDTLGAHASASVFLAWVRPMLLNFSFGLSYQYNTTNIPNSPIGQQIIFIFSAIFIHHFVLFFLEAGSFSYLYLIIQSTLINSLLSSIVILSASQLIRERRI